MSGEGGSTLGLRPVAARARLHAALIIDRIDAGRGGAESAVAIFARELVARGYRVTFLVMFPGRPPQGCRLEVVRAAARPRWRRELTFAVRACRRARAPEFDVSVGFRHVPDVDLFIPHGGRHRRAARASAEAQGGSGLVRRAVQQVSLRQQVFRGTERALLHRRPPVITVALSRRVLEDFQTAYPNAASRFVLAPGGVDINRYHPPEGVEQRERARLLLRCPPGRTSLLLVAHNARLKGLEWALRAMSRPVLRGCGAGGVHLSWAGRGRAHRFVTLAKRLGVAERFSVLGEQERIDLLYRGADVLVHPTFHDPCSLVVLEALASGLPAVTTRCNGAAELIEAHGGGRVIDAPGDVQAVARAVCELFEKGPRLREAARRAAETRPVDAHLAQLADLVEEAARRRAGLREGPS